QEDWLLHMQVVRQEPSLLPSMLASFAAQERSLVEAVAERTGTDPDRDLYPMLVAAVAIAAFRVALTQWRNRKGERSLPHLVKAAMTQVQVGLPAPATATRTAKRQPGLQRRGVRSQTGSSAVAQATPLTRGTA
ncbi:MAG: hypothetical protein WCB86_10730, partial [Candidatus Dormiibacterota bacterium]